MNRWKCAEAQPTLVLLPQGHLQRCSSKIPPHLVRKPLQAEQTSPFILTKPNSTNSSYILKQVSSCLSIIIFWQELISLIKEELSGGTVDWPQNSRLLTWLGFLGYQQAAGYVKTQCLSYAVKILPTYPVPTLGFLHFVLPCIEAFGLKCNTTIKSIFDTKSRYSITQWKLLADK